MKLKKSKDDKYRYSIRVEFRIGYGEICNTILAEHRYSSLVDAVQWFDGMSRAKILKLVRKTCLLNSNDLMSPNFDGEAGINDVAATALKLYFPELEAPPK